MRTMHGTKIRVMIYLCFTTMLLLIGSLFINNVHLNLTYAKDPNLKVELVFAGLNFPTNMAFLGPNDIIVLEKDDGTVKRITNGKLVTEPLLRTSVSSEGERGMLGVAISNESEHTYVFLYYTEKANRTSPVANRLYRYELAEEELVNPKLLLEVPAEPGSRLWPDHNGGEVVIGPDKNVYVVVGDIGGHQSLTQNFRETKSAVGSAIYRISQDGKSVGGILSEQEPLNKIYAYGIRNSFGMDFDPVTGSLWDTENGESIGDEINLVEPGFNSGWSKVQGIWKSNTTHTSDTTFEINDDNQLVDFNGKGKYRTPEFIWEKTVGPTAIKFFNSDKFGKKYVNDTFVADTNYGQIYHFELTNDRTALELHGSVADKINGIEDGAPNNVLAELPGAITDMQVGPDGYLYVLTVKMDYWNYEKDEKLIHGGSIYRITPRSP